MTRKQSSAEATGRPTNRSDLVVASNFIQAAREMGYTSVSSAVAELIDNSIQAGAARVSILITRPDESGFPRIEIEDDGAGMTPSELATCLRFGGSTRFGDRSSLGRFGVGLPAASMSQSRRVEVRSWQTGKAAYCVDLDLDEVASGRSPNFKPVRDPEMPKSGYRSGTRVTWTSCDRIEYKRLAWLERGLRRDLGRTFRDFIHDGLTLVVGSNAVDAVDPLMRDTTALNATPTVPLSDLVYEIVSGPKGPLSKVTVTFTELPVDPWTTLDTKDKRSMGIVGGAGVSVMRAGREISAGWLFMGEKRKENYDDWWRCEIRFEPELDDLFGISNTKQGIRPTQHLEELLSMDLEPIARLLNNRVRQAFETAKFAAAASRSCKVAASAEIALPVLGRPNGSAGQLTYALRSEARAGSKMFSTGLDGNVLTVTLDRDHAAFAALYAPLQSMDSDAGRRLRGAVELLILSFARTALNAEARGDQEALLSEWSRVYSKMVQRL
jgi:hypothetical protein